MDNIQISYVGPDKTDIELRDALALLHSVRCALGDGKTEFSLEVEKTDDGSRFVLTTLSASQLKTE
jgi:hypothetical protein